MTPCIAIHWGRPSQHRELQLIAVLENTQVFLPIHGAAAGNHPAGWAWLPLVLKCGNALGIRGGPGRGRTWEVTEAEINRARLHRREAIASGWTQTQPVAAWSGWSRKSLSAETRGSRGARRNPALKLQTGLDGNA